MRRLHSRNVADAAAVTHACHGPVGRVNSNTVNCLLAEVLCRMHTQRHSFSATALTSGSQEWHSTARWLPLPLPLLCMCTMLPITAVQQRTSSGALFHTARQLTSTLLVTNVPCTPKIVVLSGLLSPALCGATWGLTLTHSGCSAASQSQARCAPRCTPLQPHQRPCSR